MLGYGLFDSPKIPFKKFFNRKLDISKVSELYLEVLKTLFDLNPQLFFASDLGEKLGLTKVSKALRQPLAINDTYFIEANLGNKAKFDKIIVKALKNRTVHVLSNPCAFLFTFYLCNLWFNQGLCPIISVLHYKYALTKFDYCEDELTIKYLI